jgi:hypothetical protein
MKWISVKDKLPEPEQYIIYHAPGIFDAGPQAWIGQYDPSDGCFFSRAGFFGGGEVTHWAAIELPEIKEEN